MSVTVKPKGWYSAQIALNDTKTSSGSFGFTVFLRGRQGAFDHLLLLV